MWWQPPFVASSAFIYLLIHCTLKIRKNSPPFFPEKKFQICKPIFVWKFLSQYEVYFELIEIDFWSLFALFLEDLIALWLCSGKVRWWGWGRPQKPRGRSKKVQTAFTSKESMYTLYIECDRGKITRFWFFYTKFS